MWGGGAVAKDIVRAVGIPADINMGWCDIYIFFRARCSAFTTPIGKSLFIRPSCLLYFARTPRTSDI